MAGHAPCRTIRPSHPARPRPVHRARAASSSPSPRWSAPSGAAWRDRVGAGLLLGLGTGAVLSVLLWLWDRKRG
ncbi:MAG: hypothetical protein U5M50_03385 [Sphingobium sp.]|nr:hypothetical protein [Sphingobium sp.]